MAKTRKELLAKAYEIVTVMVEASDRGNLTPDAMIAYSTLAQACVMLAKELRESDKEVD